MKKRLTDQLATYLKKEGIEQSFAITGAGSVRIIESFKDANIKINYFHHEQAAVMASIGYTKLSGKTGVVIVTGGPGAINSVTGIASAQLDSIPIIILGGQEKSEYYKSYKDLRAYGVQGLDMVSITKPITKTSFAVKSEKDIKNITKVINEAEVGRKGPVWIDLPQDVQWLEVSELRKYTEKISNKSCDIGEVIEALKNSEKPLFWIGYGVRSSGAAELTSDFLNDLDIPTLVSWQAADIIRDDHKCFAGRAGTYGQRWANIALQKCDFLLTIGTRLAIPQRGYSDTEFAPKAKKFIVDIDNNELMKFNFKNANLINDDAKNFIKKLSKINLTTKREKILSWKKEIQSLRKRFPMSRNNNESGRKGTDVYHFIDNLSECMGGDDIVVTDMGSSLTVTHSTIRLKERQRILTSTGLGEMGFGLPASIGVRLAEPKKRVILVVGEGSLMFNLQELETMSSLANKPKLIILNNNSYLSIQHTIKALYGKQDEYAGTSPSAGVTFPDLNKVLTSFNIKTEILSHDTNLKVNIDNFLKSNNDALIVNLIEGQELIPKSAIKVDSEGNIYSPPLEDMYPFLPKKELKELMED